MSQKKFPGISLDTVWGMIILYTKKGNNMLIFK